jgi:DMSO/TMAO reductase YedYZ heme-binding membrane subunit
MARSRVGNWTGEQPAAGNYQPTQYGGQNTYQPGPYPGGAAGYPGGAGDYPGGATDTRPAAQPPVKEPAVGLEPQRAAKNRVDEWMEKDFKFGGSRVKRKAVALILLGIPGVVPLFFMLPALITVNANTFSVSVDDTLGTGAELCLFISLLVTPMTTLTGQRWFFGLRRWYGLMMACCAFGDATGAAITDTFAGGVFGRLAGHTFTLVGFIMAVLLVPLFLTGNPWAQRKLGKYWKTLHRLIYVIWGLLACHLMLLEGFGFESGNNGSGFAGDGDPIFHQRFYQYTAASLFLLTLRLPPVRKWIEARQKEGRMWLAWAVIAPIFALFIFAMIFIINEEIFKGVDSFTEHPSAE